MMEGVAAYTQTEPEGTQHSTMDTTSIASIETKKGLGVPLWLLAGVGKGGRGEGVALEVSSLTALSPQTRPRVTP